MQIAEILSRFREGAGLTQGGLGRAVGVSTSTISRYEDWRSSQRLSWRLVEKMCAACGCGPDEVESTVSLARESRDGWWVGNRDVQTWLSPLLGLEYEATEIRIFADSYFPEPFRTPAYAAALSMAAGGGTACAEAAGRVSESRLRELILVRPPRFRLILQESALTRTVGGASVMLDQLDYVLAGLRILPVEIRMLSEQRVEYVGPGSFRCLSGMGAQGFEVAVCDTLVEGVCYDAKPQSSRFSELFERTWDECSKDFEDRLLEARRRYSERI
ncbi:Scr1 family TA system antitoxin-like transcriptional regulator [Kitasatospora sp. NPDC085879]|uniref:Scr1 family TA system antitoxin-like transcriptional regulator n=1 Tax=Kitasatospora sp. NPDC085879 TaxID=3154769 RepID=UPI003422A330